MSLPEEITFILSRSPEDPKQFSEEYQNSLNSVFAAFRSEGITTRPRLFLMDSIDAAGGFTGEFIAVVKMLGPSALTGLTGWLAGRNGRKVKIKVGEIEAEAHSIKELDEILKRVERLKQDTAPKLIHE